MGKLNIDISEVKKLVELVETHHLEELSVEEGDLSVTVKGRAPQQQVPMVFHAGAGVPGAEQVYENEETVSGLVELEPEEELEGNIVDVVASLVGVFYRAPSPDAPPCVEVGDIIEVGSELGLIEAMKVFSPIPSEVAGEVIEIPAENGKLVHQGDVLVRVRIPEE